MIEDDQTVTEMRTRILPAMRRPRSFMAPEEMRQLRLTVLRIPQHKLASMLIDPNTGKPVGESSIKNWEAGRRGVALWVARRVRDLAEAARRYDAKRSNE
jgi:hypothetical protein